MYVDGGGTFTMTGGSIAGSGYTNEDGSDTYVQKDGNIPVRFGVAPADYTRVDAALNQVKALDKTLYKDFSAVEAAVNAVVRGKNTDEQAAVDAMAQAIENAITALEKKPIVEEPTHTEPENNDRSPQTNDGGSPTLWITLLFVSGGILTVSSVRGRRKKYTVR